MLGLLADLATAGALWTALAGGAVVVVLAVVARLRTRGRILGLWPIGFVLAGAFVAALTVAGSLFYAGRDLLGARGLESEQQFTSKTLFALVKLSFGVVAGAGGLAALVVAYRRQRVTENDALREATRLHTERFTTAVSQLGEESAAVRLGAVHALSGLADDAPTPELRQTCIDVLCAYLRLPYTAEADLPQGDVKARHEYLAMREVRHTVIRLIRDHLRLPHDHLHTWQGHNLDLTNVVFNGGDFSGAVFSGGAVDFSGAHFSGGTVDFGGAVFSGGQVRFGGAEFSGGQVRFSDVVFSGGAVDFGGAEFSGGQVRFGGAEFSGGQVHFLNAEFSGGQVRFSDAAFFGSVVEFSDATGAAPQGLLPGAGQPLPDGLRLPAHWLPAPSDDTDGAAT